MPRSLRFGYFDRGRLVSAPLQLVAVQNPDLIDLPKELAPGTSSTSATGSTGCNAWSMPASTSPISIGIDIKGGTFNADLYVWMRYGGDDDSPTHIEFPDLIPPAASIRRNRPRGRARTV